MSPAAEALAFRVASNAGPGGRPLDRESRAYFEPRFGFDLSRVRVHDDDDAAERARQVDAVAFTSGEHVFFDGPAPTVRPGETPELLAHELAHIVEGYAGAAPASARLAVSQPSDPAERKAREMAATVAGGASVVEGRVRTGRPPRTALIQRQPRPAPTVPPVTNAPPVSASTAPTTAPVVTQTLYDGAVALLATRNARLYGLLQPGRVGATTRVDVQHVSVPGLTVAFTYDLTLTPYVTTGGALASFNAIPPTPTTAGSTTTFAFRLDMQVSAPPAGTVNPELRLAEYLYHEGIHMLLHMDRFGGSRIPGIPVSGLLPRFGAFRTRAAAAADYPLLRLRLGELIANPSRNPSDPPPTPTTANLDSADNVIGGVLEERFAVDMQRASFPGVPPPNRTIADAYVAFYLRGERVVVAPSNLLLPDIIRLMTSVLTSLPPGSGATTTTPPTTPPTTRTGSPPTTTPTSSPGPADAGTRP